MKRKNLRFNIVNSAVADIPVTLAMVLTAQLVSTGSLSLKSFAANYVIGYVVAFLIGICLPLIYWGAGFARKCGAEPDTLKFGLLLNLVVNSGYVLLCSIVMTWFNVCFWGRQPFMPVFFLAFLESFPAIWLVSYVVSFLCSTPCRKLAERLCSA